MIHDQNARAALVGGPHKVTSGASLEHACEEPVFLVGAERSGTTMLRLMLDHHPQVTFGAESQFLVNMVTDDGRFPDLTEYREWLHHQTIGHHTGKLRMLDSTGK